MNGAGISESRGVLHLHERCLTEFGGAHGIRDAGMIESAIHQPKNDYFYARADLFGIAAAYAFHIAQGQAFLDGNKRTAIASAMTFLELNRIDTNADPAILYGAMISLAEKRLDKAGLAELFRRLFS